MNETNIAIIKTEQNPCLHGAYSPAALGDFISFEVTREAASMHESMGEGQCPLTLSCCLDVHRLKASVECRRVNNIRLKVTMILPIHKEGHDHRNGQADNHSDHNANIQSNII